MDLRIKNNNATKSYVITNNCTTRPRVCMKSDTGVPATPISYLPLTTSTTQGLALRAKVNDQSYRALEFRSMSGSATYYTSGANSAGMSSTTALTRVSTSRTEYLTRKSTSATSYLTRSSTSGTSYLSGTVTKYPTAESTLNQTYLAYSQSLTFITRIQFDSRSIPQWNTQTQNVLGKPIDLQIFWANTGHQHTYTTYSSVSLSNGNLEQRSQSGTTYGSTFRRLMTNSTYGDHYFGHGLNGDNYVLRSGIGSYKQESYYLPVNYSAYHAGGADNYDFRLSNSFTCNLSTSMESITGTSYLTRVSTSNTVYYTRSSTYDTIYHTRASTSGYSGVSSSSSETSGWQ